MHYVLIKILKTRNREYGGRKFSMAKGFRGFWMLLKASLKKHFMILWPPKSGCGELARSQPNRQLQRGLVYPWTQGNEAGCIEPSSALLRHGISNELGTCMSLGQPPLGDLELRLCSSQSVYNGSGVRCLWSHWPLAVNDYLILKLKYPTA